MKWELGQCIATSYDAAGFLRAQHDGLGASPKVGSSEVLYPLGFAARARDPETDSDGKALEGGGCKLLIGFDGTEYKVIFVGDQRALARMPPLKAGSSVQSADTGNGGPVSIDVHDGEDGTKQIYVEIDDSAHVVTIGRDGNGEPVVEFTHCRGMSLSMFRDAAVLKNRTGNVYVELKDAGGTLNGNWKVTGAFDVGAVSFPLALFPPLATAMGAIASFASAINADPAVLPSTKAAAAAAVTAIAAFIGTGATTLTKGS